MSIAQKTFTGDILVVDDTPENLKLLVDALKRGGYTVRVAPSGEMALGAVEADPPDLILLDVKMPGMDGYEVCARLKENERFSDIPVIFISALAETFDKIEAFGAGGVDYVTKPFQFEEVEARVHTHLALRRTRMELKRSLEKLREMEKLRDNLTHMIVHDMRTPLMAITNSLHHLRRDLLEKIDHRNRGDLDTASRGEQRLMRMINDLLDVSRLEEGEMPLEITTSNLGSIVDKGVHNVAAGMPNRDVRVDVKGTIAASCDAAVIQRVVENLVANGLKYTPVGGSLRVSAEEREQAARVTVRDEGPGVSPKYREKIFEKFGVAEARSDGEYHSIGLGLAFCKLAVEAHGGAIGVETGEGRGSTFWFTLPRETT